jgi:hypothetical protein
VAEATFDERDDHRMLRGGRVVEVDHVALDEVRQVHFFPFLRFFRAASSMASRKLDAHIRIARTTAMILTGRFLSIQ